MRQYLLLFLILLVFSSMAQTDTTRVLFIGNSFTYTNNVPDLVQGLAAAAGYQLIYEMHAPGGVSVGDTAQDTLAHMNNPTVYRLIRKGNWDFVSLQDNQGRFIYGHCHFPDTNVSKVVRGHLQIEDSVKHYNPCAHMLWFAGWGPKNGYGTVSATGAGLIDNIYDNYKCLRDTAHEIISPIGKAWERAAIALPAVDCWGPDLTHESLEGAYLTAAVLFTSIYRINSENVAYTGGVDSATARVFRRIAYQTVLDSIAPTNLGTYIPSLTVTSTMLSAPSGFANYRWFRNDTLIGSGAANTKTITNPSACYYVIATTIDSCKARSFEKCNAATISGIAQQGVLEFSMYPNPATGLLHIDCLGSLPVKIAIFNVYGEVVKQFSGFSHSNQFSITDLTPGLYQITVEGPSSLSRQTLVITE